jgi:3D (Asp-Asp-Asp) domain-containing protein
MAQLYAGPTDADLDAEIAHYHRRARQAHASLTVAIALFWIALATVLFLVGWLLGPFVCQPCHASLVTAAESYLARDSARPAPLAGAGIAFIPASPPLGVAASDFFTADVSGSVSLAGFAGATQPGSLDPSTPGRSRLIHCRVTGYCPCKLCCGRHACGVTASGRRAVGNLVARDRSLCLSFGTLLRVPGYAAGRPVPVLDTLAEPESPAQIAASPWRLDVLFPVHAQAKRWGVRWLAVEVLP